MDTLEKASFAVLHMSKLEDKDGQRDGGGGRRDGVASPRPSASPAAGGGGHRRLKVRARLPYHCGPACAPRLQLCLPRCNPACPGCNRM